MMGRSIEPRFRAFRIGKLRKIRRFFSGFLAGSRLQMAGAVACGAGALLMQLLRPWPLKIVFDALLVPAGHGRFPWIGRLRELPPDLLLAGVCGALLAISILWGLLSFGQAFLTARTGHAVVFGLRERVHAHLLRLSLGFHQRKRRGDLIMRLTGDINLLRDLLVDSTIQGVFSVLTLVAMAGILLVLDWRLTVVVGALLPFLALTTFRFSSRIREAARRQRQTEGRVAAAVSETLQGVQVIQTLGEERWRDKAFRRSNRRSLRAGLRTTRLEASMSRFIEVILAAGTAAVFWYGVRRVQAGALTAGDLLVFVAYVRSSFRPFRKLARVATRVAKAMVCAERVQEVLREEPEVRNRPDARRARHLQGAIGFRKVSFRYPGRGTVLRRVSFEVEPGSFVGIVGPSGAGKSTLLALALRLYDPDRGRVLVDGKDIRRFKVESVRAQMTLVPQDPFLFGTTLRENIVFRGSGVSEEDLWRALEEANALDVIEELPQGIDTSVAESGASLSTGQRQRIALARAFLRRTSILLLDEPTSGLDGASETRVLEAVRRLLPRATALMVSHELRLVRDADLILVLQRGRITERGTHAELMALGGWYAKTWKRQARRRRPTLVAVPPAELTAREAI